MGVVGQRKYVQFIEIICESIVLSKNKHPVLSGTVFNSI